METNELINNIDNLISILDGLSKKQYKKEGAKQKTKLIEEYALADDNLKIFQNSLSNSIDLDKTIVELKYDVKNSSFVDSFIQNNCLNNRNQKFSKYVNSFIEINENAFI